MSSPRKILETLFSRAGVVIGGQNPWDITVTDERFFLRVLREKNLGLGKPTWTAGGTVASRMNSYAAS